MLSGIVFVFTLIFGIHWTMAVIMCTNQSSSIRDVVLNLVPETEVSGCYCSVKLTKRDNIGSSRSKIIFEIVQFSGCKYKLVISYNNTNSIITCSNNNTNVFFHINKSGEVQLYLEPTNSQDETTTFEVRITTSITGDEGTTLRLDCFLPSTTNSVLTTPNITDEPLTTSTTVTTQRSTTKPVQPQPTSTADYIPTAQRTATRISITSTPDTISPTQVYLTTSSTSSSKTGSTRRDDDDDGDGCDDEVVFAGVIGGVIGGVIVGVAILIIMCILKYRKRSKKSSSEIYSTPQHHLPESQYTDLQIIQQNNDHN